jgi:Flp pilus assembly protein TadD
VFLLLLSQPAVATAQDRPSEEALVSQISSTIQAGRTDRAVTEARRAVAEYPQSSPLHQLLGAALFKKGMNAEARQAFHRAIELDPGVAQNHFNLALIDLSENKFAGAAKSLETHLRHEPGNAQARLLLGRA